MPRPLPPPRPGQCLKYCTWHNLCSRQKLVYQTAGDGLNPSPPSWIRQLSELKSGQREESRPEAGIRQRGQRQSWPGQTGRRATLGVCVMMANTWRTIKQLNAKSTWRAKKVRSTRPGGPRPPPTAAPDELKWGSKAGMQMGQNGSCRLPVPLPVPFGCSERTTCGS